MRGSKVYKSYVEDIRKEIVKMGLENFVVFEPFVSKISLDEIYSELDLVLLLSEYEGFGLPILEAQSHSVPVACSDIPIFREILQQSAFYLDLNFDQNEVSEFIGKINDENIMNNMALKGLNNVQQFSWNKMATETLTLYESFSIKK